MKNSIANIKEKRKKYIASRMRWGNKKDMEKAASILDRIETMRNSMTPFWEDVKKYKQYWEARYIKNDDGYANYNIPLAFSVIMNKHAEEMLMEISTKFVAVEDSDNGKKDVLEAVWRSEWYSPKSDSEKTYERAMLMRKVFGYSIIREEWLSKIRTVKDRNGSFGVDDQSSFQEKTIIDYDGCHSQYVKPQNFYWDNAVIDFNDARDCVERVDNLTVEDLIQMYKGKSGFKNLDMVLPGEDNYDEVIISANEDDIMDYDNDKVTVYHYFNRQTDEYIVIAGSNRVIIRDSAIPYDHKELPYVYFPCHYLEGSRFGRSDLQLLEQFIEIKNTARNQIVDGNNRRIEPTIFIGDTISFLDDEDYLNGIVRINGNPNDIREVTLADVSNSAYNLDKLTDDDIIVSLGIDYRGISTIKGETATKTAVKKESQLKMVNQGMKLVELTAIQRWFDLRLKNIQQFYTQPRLEFIIKEANGDPVENVKKFRTIRVEGKKIIYQGGNGKRSLKIKEKDGTFFFQVDPDVIRGQFDIIPDIKSGIYVSQELMRAKMIESITALANVMGVIPPNPDGSPPINMIPIIEKLVETMGIDSGKIFSKTEEQSSEEIKKLLSKKKGQPTNQEEAPPQKETSQIPTGQQIVSNQLKI